MDIILKGRPEEINRFVEVALYPIIKQINEENGYGYFKLTQDDGLLRDRGAGKLYKSRYFKGYFPDIRDSLPGADDTPGKK